MNMRGGEAGFGDDDRLPWLETVEDDYREGPSFGRLLLLVVLLLAVLGAGAFGYYWYQKQKSLSGNGELIAAPEGDYKVKPDEPGGMKVARETPSSPPARVTAAIRASTPARCPRRRWMARRWRRRRRR